MSAPSTPCTPPPGHWPNAATRCSRPRSRRCAGSVSAPGGSARSPPPPSSCSTTSTAAPHDQQAREAVTGNGSVLETEDFDPDLGNIAIIGVGLALVGYGVNELRTSEFGSAAMAGLKSLTLEGDQERSHAIANQPHPSAAVSRPVDPDSLSGQDSDLDRPGH